MSARRWCLSVWTEEPDCDVAARNAAVNLRRRIEGMNDSELADNMELCEEEEPDFVIPKED